jgi:transposase-like protein
MIVCPSCGSSRIRNDYKPAPFALRAFGIRALLCDHCNRQFRAFSPAAPKSRVPRQAKRQADAFNTAPAVDFNQLNQSSVTPKPEQAQRIRLNRFARAAEPQPTVAGEIVASDQPDLRTEITKLHEHGAKVLLNQGKPAQQLKPGNSVICPQCGSQDLRRRHRSGLERTVFSITDHKAFTCRACHASFYARLEEEEAETPSLKSSDAAMT